MTVTAVDKSTLAGAHSIFVMCRNTYGIANGFANLADTATGTGSGARRVLGIETVPTVIPDPTRVRRRYDDAPGDIYMFASDQIPQGNLLFGVSDITAEATAQGSSIWTVGVWDMAIRGVSAPTFQDMMILTHSQAKSNDTLTFGTSGYLNTIYPNVQIYPTGTEELRAAQTAGFRYSVTFQQFRQWITGATLSNSNFNTTDGLSVSWWSLYPTIVHSYIGDGATATITVDYTPVDTTSTKAYVATISGGVVTVTTATVSSVNTSTKVITLSAAPASGSYVNILYEASRLV